MQLSKIIPFPKDFVAEKSKSFKKLIKNYFSMETLYFTKILTTVVLYPNDWAVVVKLKNLHPKIFNFKLNIERDFPSFS
jgi:hypothetical protein